MSEKEIAEILLRVEAVTLNPEDPYVYTSGIKSPIYCDNRLLISNVEERKKIVDSMVDAIESNDLEFDLIGGTSTAGIPWASFLANRLDKPMIYIRGESKDHGKENRIEGELKEGQKVLVIEDLVSTGGSSVSVVGAVREAGGVVDNCLSIFTYELDKSKTNFENADCNLVSLTNFSTLIDVAQETGYISEKEAEKALEWSKDPGGWGKKYGFE